MNKPIVTVKIIPFEHNVSISEEEIRRMKDFLKDDNQNEDESSLRQIAIREIITPIAENNLEFEFEEVKE